MKVNYGDEMVFCVGGYDSRPSGSVHQAGGVSGCEQGEISALFGPGLLDRSTGDDSFTVSGYPNDCQFQYIPSYLLYPAIFP